MILYPGRIAARGTGTSKTSAVPLVPFSAPAFPVPTLLISPPAGFPIEASTNAVMGSLPEATGSPFAGVGSHPEMTGPSPELPGNPALVHQPPLHPPVSAESGRPALPSSDVVGPPEAACTSHHASQVEWGQGLEAGALPLEDARTGTYPTLPRRAPVSYPPMELAAPARLDPVESLSAGPPSLPPSGAVAVIKPGPQEVSPIQQRPRLIPPGSFQSEAGAPSGRIEPMAAPHNIFPTGIVQPPPIPAEVPPRSTGASSGENTAAQPSTAARASGLVSRVAGARNTSSATPRRPWSMRITCASRSSNRRPRCDKVTRA